MSELMTQDRREICRVVSCLSRHIVGVQAASEALKPVEEPPVYDEVTSSDGKGIETAIAHYDEAHAQVGIARCILQSDENIFHVGIALGVRDQAESTNRSRIHEHLASRALLSRPKSSVVACAERSGRSVGIRQGERE